eukprot:gb/GFBE01083389.1/.p1 GENE.gb/GFBE01083389.1/~~gb/GFBE01083389.1/.p1  ORF type:complete len:204 (+),score=57.92 gb/GFBE01083389.1/:1-612(+)
MRVDLRLFLSLLCLTFSSISAELNEASSAEEWGLDDGSFDENDELLLLQVQYSLKKLEVSAPASEVAVASHEEPAPSSDAEGQPPLRHWSTAATLLMSRSSVRTLTEHLAARVRDATGGPDLVGEVILTAVTLLVWLMLMMLCSWLGFGGFNRMEDAQELQRQAEQEHQLPPEKHDPIDKAAKQMREAQKKQAQARKEKTACC